MDDTYRIDSVSTNQALFGFGDAVCVPVIRWIHFRISLRAVVACTGGCIKCLAGILPQVRMLRDGIDSFLSLVDEKGRRVNDAKFGIYAFYDYDDEPIYVGQTREQLRVRIRRHLTNQRTDAVAMNVLDPFEVASIEVWPFWDLIEDNEESRDILTEPSTQYIRS